MHLHSSIFLPILALALVAESHMLLNKPQIFPSQAIPDNGPLVGPGKGASNYPCKSSPGSTTVYDFSFPRTQMPLGSNYSLELKGQAVHGGGSCQISLSKDLAPTAQSTFKVIHSIEGGCPVRNTAGNLGSDASAIDPDHYEFEIPAGLEPGDYTFAWTWFNKVGNREMYMNCAPITITGAVKKRDAAGRDAAATFDALPDLFLANLPDVECLSPEEGPNANLQFPNPGSSVEMNTPSNLSPPRGNVAACHAPVGKAAAAPASSNSISSSVESTPVPTSTASASVSELPSPTSLVVIPVTETSSTAATITSVSINLPRFTSTSTVYVLLSSAPPAPTSSTEPGTLNSTPSSTPAAASCPAGRQPCQTVGAIVCVGAQSFGICDVNLCAVAQPLASGTVCNNGAITKRSLRLPPHARAAAA